MRTQQLAGAGSLGANSVANATVGDPPAPSADAAISQMQAKLQRLELQASRISSGVPELAPYSSPLEQFPDLDPRTGKTPACHVPMYRQGGDIPIDNFTYAMELFFKSNNIHPSLQVPITMTNSTPSTTNEVLPYTNLPFLEFRDRLRLMFREPELSAASLAASHRHNSEQGRDRT